MTKFVPVHDAHGNVQLYDIYVDGTWIGSRRTLVHCAESVRNYRRAN